MYTRVAEHDGTVYLDLSNARWEAVKITRAGWEVISNPPVLFARGKGVLPLPTPTSGGSIEALREFVNITDEEWPLYVAYIIGALNPSGPYPLLAIHGEQGSGKSTATRVIKELIDPTNPPLRTAPETPKSVIVSAMNNHVLAYTNLSDIPTWLSELLCCLSTDGGYSIPTFYETLDETTFTGRRPVCINGISDLIRRSDLLSRAILLNLRSIPDSQRKDEKTFWQRFDEAKPAILGSLCDAISVALRNSTSVRLDSVPRMADFAKWVVAAEPALPWSAGQFLRAYTENRAEANVKAIESDQTAGLIIKFAEGLATDEWEGTAAELLACVKPEGELPKWFPPDGTRLSAKLMRLAPNLRALGVDVERLPREGSRRPLRIRKVAKESEGGEIL